MVSRAPRGRLSIVQTGWDVVEGVVDEQGEGDVNKLLLLLSLLLSVVVWALYWRSCASRSSWMLPRRGSSSVTARRWRVVVDVGMEVGSVWEQRARRDEPLVRGAKLPEGDKRLAPKELLRAREEEASDEVEERVGAGDEMPSSMLRIWFVDLWLAKIVGSVTGADSNMTDSIV